MAGRAATTPGSGQVGEGGVRPTGAPRTLDRASDPQEGGEVEKHWSH